MSEVIKVQEVTKIYKLYDKPSLRFKEAFSITKKKYHKNFDALKGISFSVNQGEMVGIVGKNGAGKSTLLKIITGVLNPTSGKVVINGKISALLELGAGFNPEYTGIENAYLNGTMIGFTKEEMDTKMDDILNFADIGDFINQPVKTYSSGMFARLAFAVAINVEPDILIVDEALSVGDVFFQSKCYKKLEDLKKNGKTILFVTHDMGSVIKYCDRAILIEGGKVVAEGDSAEIVDVYKKVLVGQFKESNDENKNKIIKKTENDDEKDIWKNYMILNPNSQIYGDLRAEIIDFGIFSEDGEISNTVYKFEEFTIKIKIKFNTDIDNPIFAFSIKDIKGTEITGTNTVIEKVDTGINNKGDLSEVEFTQKMSLQGGQYLLSLGCTGFEKDSLVVYNRLYDVCCVNVISDKTTVGYFDLNTKVKLIKN